MTCSHINMSMPWTRLDYASKISLFMDTFMEHVHAVDMKELFETHTTPCPVSSMEGVGYGG
jgi:hypothetical protein